MINVSWDNQKSPTHCCRPTRKRLIHVLTREGNHGLAGHHKTGLLQIKFLINAVNKELLVVVVLVLLLPGRNCHKMTTWKFNAQLKLTAANCSRPCGFSVVWRGSHSGPDWDCESFGGRRTKLCHLLQIGKCLLPFSAFFSYQTVRT